MFQNVTLCKTKSPVYVSRPHFYLADQSYLKQFQHGLSPDPEIREQELQAVRSQRPQHVRHEEPPPDLSQD